MKSIPVIPATIVATLVMVLALAAGYWFGRRTDSAVPVAPTAQKTAEPEVLYWFDPMVPDQHFDKPGKSPFMDMQLVPKLAGDSKSGVVPVDAGLQQSLGIRTVLVTVGNGAASEFSAPGTVQWDLRGERRISSRVEGYVEQVHVRAPFERVRAGQPLVSLTAPRLAAAMAEYRALASSRSAESRAVTAAARARLRLLGIGDSDLRASPGGAPQLVLRAPADGVLAEITVRAGDTVVPGQVMFRLNETRRVWVEMRLPPGAAGAITPGMAVEVRVASFPGETFQGEVDSLLPELDAQTRTQGLRVLVDNSDGRLAAGMFAEATLRTADSAQRPWIPSEALILTGREARVIVADGKAGFRPVRVRVGREAAGRSEILHGLKGGERVVVSGQFLLDSEASLSGALQRLGDGEEQP